MVPELSAKADNLIVALGRLAAAQESAGTIDLERLFESAQDARDEMAGLVNSQQVQ